MIRVAILGASGYSALELMKLLLRHPEAKITALTTRQPEPRPIAQVHPSLAGRLNLTLENLSSEEVAERADAVFCCLPHGASAAAVAKLLPAGKKVIDLSADYRLTDPAEYAKWYGLEHADPGRLSEAVYGLPELYRDMIAGAVARRQSRLLSDVGHPRPRAAPASRRDLATRHHHRQQERRHRRRPRAEAHLPFPRVQRKRLGLRRRHPSPHAGNRPDPLRRGRRARSASSSRPI